MKIAYQDNKERFLLFQRGRTDPERSLFQLWQLKLTLADIKDTINPYQSELAYDAPAASLTED